MKIRSDFVTNSSSSSMVTIRASLKDGSKKDLLFQEEANWSGETLPSVFDGKITYCSDAGEVWPVDTIEALVTLLFFFDAEQSIDPEVVIPILYYYMGRISAELFCELLRDKDGFEELALIARSSDENIALKSNKINDVIDEAIEERYEIVNISKRDISAFAEFMSSSPTINDVEEITIIETESEWGEFLADCTAQIIECYENLSEELPCLNADNPLIEDETKKWERVLREKMLGPDIELLSDTYESLARKAVQSGDPYDLVPSSILETRSNVFVNFNKVTCNEETPTGGCWDSCTICNNPSLERLVVPHMITTLKRNAVFNCPSLKCVVIHDNVTNIEENAFGNCGSVTIQASPESFAASYAKAHGIPWKNV